MASLVADTTAPAVVDATLESASQPENRARLGEIFRSEPVRAGVAELEGAAVDTVLARLAAPENEERLRRITKVIASATASELLLRAPHSRQENAGGAVGQAAKVAVASAMSELAKLLPGFVRELASNPDVQAALAPLSRTAGAGAVQGAGDTIKGQGPPRE
jgi:hypothetical protein